jgi:hypothetical protein
VERGRHRSNYLWVFAWVRPWFERMNPKECVAECSTTSYPFVCLFVCLIFAGFHSSSRARRVVASDELPGTCQSPSGSTQPHFANGHIATSSGSMQWPHQRVIRNQEPGDGFNILCSILLCLGLLAFCGFGLRPVSHNDLICFQPGFSNQSKTRTATTRILAGSSHV